MQTTTKAPTTNQIFDEAMRDRRSSLAPALASAKVLDLAAEAARDYIRERLPDNPKARATFDKAIKRLNKSPGNAKAQADLDRALEGLEQFDPDSTVENDWPEALETLHRVFDPSIVKLVVKIAQSLRVQSDWNKQGLSPENAKGLQLAASRIDELKDAPGSVDCKDIKLLGTAANVVRRIVEARLNRFDDWRRTKGKGSEIEFVQFLNDQRRELNAMADAIVFLPAIADDEAIPSDERCGTVGDAMREYDISSSTLGRLKKGGKLPVVGHRGGWDLIPLDRLADLGYKRKT